jgi:RHS repeat-associated protein
VRHFELHPLERTRQPLHPFGLNHTDPRRNTGGLGVNKYQYNGKELVDDGGLGWHSYGKRYYDAAIGRFPNVDPLIDTFHFVSGYNYAENEPVAHVDLWGLQQVSYLQILKDAYDKFSLKMDLNLQVTAGNQVGLEAQVGPVAVGGYTNSGSTVLYGQNATVLGLSNAQSSFVETNSSDNVKTTGSEASIGLYSRENSTTTTTSGTTTETETSVGFLTLKESSSTNGSTSNSSSDLNLKVGVDVRLFLGVKVEFSIGITDEKK